MDAVKPLAEEIAAIVVERDAARAKRDAARAEVAHMKREQQAMIMQHRHDIRDLGQLLQDERCKVATIEAAWYAARAGEARAVEALKRIFIGGNHLASALIGLLGPSHPPYQVSLDEAINDIGPGNYYDLWVAWKVIMTERDGLAQPALAWLAQQRAEAAAEALEKLATDLRQDPWGTTLHDVDSLRSILRTRAAALRAGGGR